MRYENPKEDSIREAIKNPPQLAIKREKKIRFVSAKFFAAPLLLVLVGALIKWQVSSYFKPRKYKTGSSSQVSHESTSESATAVSSASSTTDSLADKIAVDSFYANLPVKQVTAFGIPNAWGTAILIPQSHRYPGSAP